MTREANLLDKLFRLYVQQAKFLVFQILIISAQILNYLILCLCILGGSHDCMVVGFTTTYAISAYHH